ncbi:MAG TPA: OmpA family protein [Burkholderiales bacterium]|nr:OmpA family protein [Burkholderiales bacterium]
MQARYLGPLAALLVLGGCATSQDLVVLLPDKDGKVGKVFVHNSKGEAVLDTAYAAARTSSGGVTRETASQSEVKDVFGGALTAMPPRPISFTLYFESGTDEFTDQSKQEIKRVIAEMARRQAPEITVIGHTDQVGPDPTNDALSLQRAERVKSILVGMGIPPGRILTAGRGRREPLVRAADGASEPRNRRVEISVR